MVKLTQIGAGTEARFQIAVNNESVSLPLKASERISKLVLAR